MGRCSTSALAASLSDVGAAAGTAYQELLFANVSTRTCTLQGYPAVSFIDGHGGQIGAAVPRTAAPTGAGSASASAGGVAPGVLVTLAPGGTAVAPLAYHDAYVATVPDCQPTAAAGVKVIPPGQMAALTVPTRLMVCANPQANGSASISPIVASGSVRP